MEIDFYRIKVPLESVQTVEVQFDGFIKGTDLVDWWAYIKIKEFLVIDEAQTMIKRFCPMNGKNRINHGRSLKLEACYVKMLK